MGLLDGKRVLVTGVLTDSSIAFHVARIAQQEGARVVLTGFVPGREAEEDPERRISLVRRVAQRLPEPAPVLELDVANSVHLETLADRIGEHVDGLDGVVHGIAFAPGAALGGNFLNTEWSDVATALQVSAYSLKALAMAVLPLMKQDGGAIVGMDFDARQAWPAYDWMGVSKATLESCARYLARYLGQYRIRVNLMAAGPLRTMAMKSIPGAEQFESLWAGRAPLGWDLGNHEPAARGCVALLSDWFPATTGEIVHVDGGAHAMGG